MASLVIGLTVRVVVAGVAEPDPFGLVAGGDVVDVAAHEPFAEFLAAFVQYQPFGGVGVDVEDFGFVLDGHGRTPSSADRG